MDQVHTLPQRIAWFAPWTWKRRYIVATVLLLVFAAYPLSIGPAWGLLMRGWLPSSLYHVVYAPIHWLGADRPAVQRIIGGYVQLFDPFD